MNSALFHVLCSMFQEIGQQFSGSWSSGIYLLLCRSFPRKKKTTHAKKEEYPKKNKERKKPKAIKRYKE